MPSGPRSAEPRPQPASGDAAPDGDGPAAGPVGGRYAPDEQSDEWLVRKARAGEGQAWEVLLRRHRDRIYRIALRVLGNAHDAEDVTQDVAVQLLTALAGFSGGSSFTTWLYRIVINRCLNHQRRTRRVRPLEEADHPVVEGPERTVLARSRTAATAAAIAAMPPDLRIPLVLHEMEGLTYSEVAAVLAISEAAVRGRIHRGRRVLLREMRAWA